MTPGSRTLLDYVQAPVLVGDPDGRIVYVNAAFEADFRVTALEVAGLPLAGVFEGGGREAVLRAVARVCDGRSEQNAVRFSLLVQDRAYRALVSAVETEGGRVGVIVLLMGEGSAEARLHSFRREIQTPLDELSASLASLAEHATGPNASAQRLAIADGVRSIERMRKWAEAVAASLGDG